MTAQMTVAAIKRVGLRWCGRNNVIRGVFCCSGRHSACWLDKNWRKRVGKIEVLVLQFQSQALEKRRKSPLKSLEDMTISYQHSCS